MRGIGAGERVDDVERRLARELVGDLVAQPLEVLLGELLVAVPPDPVLGARLADDELVLRRAAGVPAGVDDERAALGDPRFAAPDRMLVERSAVVGFQMTLPLGANPCVERSTRPRTSMAVIGSSPFSTRSMRNGTRRGTRTLHIVCAMTGITLDDRVVALRPWTCGDDAEAIVACIDGDPEITRWLDQVPQPYTLEDARAYIGGLGEQAFAITGTEAGLAKSVGRQPARHLPDASLWVCARARPTRTLMLRPSPPTGGRFKWR